MNPAESVAVAEPVAGARRPANPAQYLYVAAALLLLLFTALGFQQFYLHGQAYPTHPLAPPIRGLLIAHGVAMTSWILLFLVQTVLVRSGNRKLHMKLGVFGAALAAVMVVLGLWLPIQTTRFEPDVVLWGMNRKAFMTVPMTAIITFGIFVAIAVRQRRKPEIHRPMMLLASLAIIAAATDRITGLPDLYATTIWGRIWGPFFIAVLTGAVFLAVKTVLTRSFDRWFAAGFALLVVASALPQRVGPTVTWNRIANYLVKS